VIESTEVLVDDPEEKLVNNRRRVRRHGEVFTPSRIVKQMLDLPSIREASQDLTMTFFEPGTGQGAFLVEVLRRKLLTVEKYYNDTLIRYENYSLLALSTLYGIELLEDNTKICAMELYRVFYDAYLKQLKKYNRKPKPSVLGSAELIIAKNIVQGDFLTKWSPNGTPVVFSEWKVLNLEKLPTSLIVQRTEYTLEEVGRGVTKRAGALVDVHGQKGQLFLPFDANGHEAQATRQLAIVMRYLPCKITSVNREELEEFNGEDTH